MYFFSYILRKGQPFSIKEDLLELKNQLEVILKSLLSLNVKLFKNCDIIFPMTYHVWALGKLLVLVSTSWIVNNLGPAAPVEPKIINCTNYVTSVKY